MITKQEAIEQYQLLISTRRNSPAIKTKPGEVEIHHIVPKSCGGLDTQDNTIKLYAKEHFMAHVYLYIIHHDDEFHFQTMCALNKMVQGTINGDRVHIRDFVVQSEEYQIARQEFALYVSNTMKYKVSGQNSHSFGKHWYYDPLTLNCNQFYETDVPSGWIRGRVFKDKESFSQKMSKLSSATRWVRKIDLSDHKRICIGQANQLIKSGEWEFGKLPYTQAQKDNIKLKLKHKHKRQIHVRHKKCKQCGNDNSNKFAMFCCDECKLAYINKQKIDKTMSRLQDTQKKVLSNGMFDSQSTKLYRGVVNRKQVRRFLLSRGIDSCQKCGSRLKLTIHSIDGNCRNLSIDNYELLCHECYVKSNHMTNQFFGTIFHEIFVQLKCWLNH